MPTDREPLVRKINDDEAGQEYIPASNVTPITSGIVIPPAESTLSKKHSEEIATLATEAIATVKCMLADFSLEDKDRIRLIEIVGKWSKLEQTTVVANLPSLHIEFVLGK